MSVIPDRHVVKPRRPDEGPIDPERCRKVAAQRARRELRRLCKEHLLFFQWTLTFGDGGQRDLTKLRRQVERFVAKVVAERGGERFPWVYVVEFHEGGERLHVHMAVPFWFPHERLKTLWGHGHVWITDKRKRGECRFVGAVRAAGYLSKYLDKTFGETEFGRHRYEVARGWKVKTYQVRVRDLDEGQRYAEAVFVAAAEYVWHSSSCEEWAGPPTRVLFFMARAPND